jgi:hypothetical protein
MLYKKSGFDPYGPWPESFHPIMFDLYNILKDNDGLNDFIESIKVAIKTDLDELHDLEITTPEEYIAFMNSLTTWSPKEQKRQVGLYAPGRLLLRIQSQAIFR